MTEQTHQAIVIGDGVAGLAAAVALAEQDMTVALLGEGMFGGLVLNIGHLDGDAAYAGQSGADFASGYLNRAMEKGVDYRMARAEALVRKDGLWAVPDQDVAAPVAVLATGAALKKLGVPGEDRLYGMGVSQCAYCDGGLYRDKDVLVVGGGDAAFQEALHLAEVGCKTTMLLRSPARARAAHQEKAAAAGIAIREGVEVAEVLGESGVEGVKTADGETLAADGVFVFIGLEPETALAPDEAAREDGALVVNAHMATDQPDLYAIGAARAGYDGSLATALADAAKISI